MKHIVAIDFGSSKVAVAAGLPSQGGFKIVAYVQEPLSLGIKNGEITNDTKVEQFALLPAIRKIEAEIGEKVTEAAVNISGRFLGCTESVYSVIRTKNDTAITEAELEGYDKVQFKRKYDDPQSCVFDAVAQSYSVDDNIGFSKEEIIGMSGGNLEIKYKIIYGNETIINHRKKVLEDCGIRMTKTVLSQVASARAVMTPQEMENGAALVDIGGGATHISIVKDKIVRYVYTIPFGGESVTNDIKQVTNLSKVWAERVKVEYGCCIEEASSENKKLILNGEGGIKEDEVDLTLLTRIIEARVSEILEAAAYIINESGYAGKIPGGVVLTGGTCYMQYIQDLAKAIMEYKVRLASPSGSIAPDSVEESFDTYSSTVVGLCLETEDPLLTVGKTIEINSSTQETSAEKEETEEPAPETREESDSKKGGFFSGLFSKKPKNEETLFGDSEDDIEKVAEQKINECPEIRTAPASTTSRKSKKNTKNNDQDSHWSLFNDIFTDNDQI